MLFTKKTKRDVMDVCDSIMDGTELTMEQLNAAYLFSSEVNDKIEKKVVLVLKMIYPSVWEQFCELDNFNIYDETLYFTYADLDNKLIASGFPLRLLGLSEAELEAEAENMQKD